MKKRSGKEGQLRERAEERETKIDEDREEGGRQRRAPSFLPVMFSLQGGRSGGCMEVRAAYGKNCCPH